MYPLESSSWWKSEKYKIHRDGFIGPMSGLQFGSDFNTYDPIQNYFNNPEDAAHIHLLNKVNPNKPESVREFFCTHGPLGIGLRVDIIGDKDDFDSWGDIKIQPHKDYLCPINMNESDSCHRSTLFEDKHFKVGQTIEGDRHFKFFLKRPPNDIPFRSEAKRRLPELIANYGEWVYLPNINRDSEFLPNHPKRYEFSRKDVRPGSFSYAVELFRKSVNKFEEGKVAFGENPFSGDRIYDGHFQPIFISDSSQNLRIQATNLLDLCFVMTAFDLSQGKLLRCMECGDFARKMKKNARKFCSDTCRDKANNRKSRQRSSLRRKLQEKAVLNDWYSNAHNNPEHPFHHLKELEEMDKSNTLKGAILEWAKKTKKNQDESSATHRQCWIKPILKIREGN